MLVISRYSSSEIVIIFYLSFDFILNIIMFLFIIDATHCPDLHDIGRTPITS